VKLPESTSSKAAEDTVVRRQRDRDPRRRPQGRDVADVIDGQDDVIAPLKAELDAAAPPGDPQENEARASA
jgi:hypothetical protein